LPSIGRSGPLRLPPGEQESPPFDDDDDDDLHTDRTNNSLVIASEHDVVGEIPSMNWQNDRIKFSTSA
jgi:predicted small lipoprotein YifL